MEAPLYSQCTVQPDGVLVWTKWWFGYWMTKTQWNSHAQSYMHPGVLGTIQIRAGSWVYRTGCERGRAVRGRSVLWILMSGRVVGMERNNRVPLCSTLHPSYSQRRKETFSQSLPPSPFIARDRPFILTLLIISQPGKAHVVRLIISDSTLASPQGQHSDPHCPASLKKPSVVC